MVIITSLELRLPPQLRETLPPGKRVEGQHPGRELTPHSELWLCSILYFGVESSPDGCFVSSSFNVIESIALI